jgi:hypothetical protein
MGKNIPSKQSEFIVPKNFPSCVYSKISSIMNTQNQKYPQSVSEFSYAWMAVKYRFESNKNFTKSVKKFGDGPPPFEKYIQEKELFHFFINGYSTLDCFGYALYMFASILKPDSFPIDDSYLKRIYFINIGSKKNKNKKYILFEDIFPKEKITNELKLIKNSEEFKDWKTIRNALIHRISPGRVFHLPGGKTTWNIDKKTFDIDECFTSSRLSWLEDSLINLLDAVLNFTSKSIQNYHLNSS